MLLDVCFFFKDKKTTMELQKRVGGVTTMKARSPGDLTTTAVTGPNKFALIRVCFFFFYLQGLRNLGLQGFGVSRF